MTDQQELAAIHAEVRRILDANRDSWMSHALAPTGVQVSLYGGREALAQELHERFGDAVELRVGLHRYPFDVDAQSEPGPRLPELPAVQPSDAELDRVGPDRVGPDQGGLGPARLDVLPDPDSLKAGSSIRGRLQVTNASKDRRLRFETDEPLTGDVLDSLGRRVSGPGVLSAGIGRRFDLGPGESGEVRFVVGTGSLDLRLGSTLPAGRYQLIITVPVRSQSDKAAAAVTAPVEIELHD